MHTGRLKARGWVRQQCVIQAQPVLVANPGARHFTAKVAVSVFGQRNLNPSMIEDDTEVGGFWRPDARLDYAIVLWPHADPGWLFHVPSAHDDQSFLPPLPWGVLRKLCQRLSTP